MAHDEAFKAIHNGVFVITTRDGDRVNGMTAAWVMRTSFDPPLVAVSVGTSRYSHGLIRESGVFAVNVLSEGQVAEGKLFGFRSGRNTDKFEGLEYGSGATGSPILKDIAAYLDCRVVGSIDTGDHTIFVGEVVDSRAHGDRPPLPFRREDFFG
jgi:flavin reductase (DIM6/NTAB) family NADH-FMN oxidoreductase RutF